MNNRFDSSNIPQYAESRFATNDEIVSSLSTVNPADDTIEKGGMPIYQKSKNEICIDTQDNHSIIFGSTGSKKTRLFCIPTVELLARSGESMVITDPKSEIYERCSGTLAKRGYKNIVLNFRDPSSGNFWNPLNFPYLYWSSGKEGKSMELANDIISSIVFSPTNKTVDPYWEDTTAQLMTGIAYLLFMYVDKKDVNISSVTQMVSTGINADGSGILNQIASELPKNSIPFINLNSIFGLKAEKTLSCILSTFYTKMRLFSSQQDLMAMLSKSDFDIGKIGFEKTALFLIMPDEKTTINFLISLFIKQLYQSLIDAAQGAPGGALPIRVNFLLDEFANLPTINDMPAMISASRSRNLRFYLLVQSMNSLVAKYEENAQTIMGNCANWVFLTSRELPLLNLFSDLCGIDEQGNRLLSTSQLQRLSKEKGEALILCGRNYPFVTNLPDMDDYPFERLPAVPLPTNPTNNGEAFSIHEFVKAFAENNFKNSGLPKSIVP